MGWQKRRRLEGGRGGRKREAARMQLAAPECQDEDSVFAPGPREDRRTGALLPPGREKKKKQVLPIKQTQRKTKQNSSNYERLSLSVDLQTDASLLTPAGVILPRFHL